MQLIRGAHSLTDAHHGCVATIGNFDGVHLGHAEIIKRLKRHAAAHGVPSTLIIFEPQPAEYFARDRVPARLTRFREKFNLIRQRGVDRLLVLRFDEHLRTYTPQAFVEEFLVRRLGVKALIIGDDFRFGSGRGGDFGLLHELAERHGFVLEQTPPFLFIGKRISSTYIRYLLRHGYMKEAERMLGHPYCIEGHVVHGHKQGREWGFPTANLNLHRIKSPLSGIFAVRVHGLGDPPRMGVAYVGNRPIIDDPRYVLEVHIFDYDDDCYGKLISVQFCDRIRDDMNFDSFAVMAEQIRRDCEVARERLTFEYGGA
ncbi:MAG: bifunctional riboflavin kinase/FAD synthetase [Gammaproteobacteria bacterium]|nr:bifunctional riboflavin kinase/FAD synthetase [Gammaproteobacteria bacterium]MCP5202343.1 bifunctional riboflavin kinase/FAD synthetase [Gammaproteobacteria bacterium]